MQYHFERQEGGSVSAYAIRNTPRKKIDFDMFLAKNNWLLMLEKNQNQNLI